jgi:thiol-disulfide isomerase/thioredoxin
MKKVTFLSLILTLSLSSFSQGGYEIKINFKGLKDTVAYLARYTFDKQYMIDTCKKVSKGNVVFKGKKDLNKGVYFLVSQDKVRYFDFFINETQKFSINTDISDIVNTLKSTGSKENEAFFSYIKFITNKNKEFSDNKDKTKGMSKTDSTKFMTDKAKILDQEVKKFDADFMAANKGTFIYDVMNLKTEKEPKDVPKAKNGRPDSVYAYNYYKQHYWDGVNFKDDRLLHTPFFADRLKKYFSTTILQAPDTIIVEIDKIMNQATPGSEMYKFLLAYFTPTYESSKIMGFDKIFVHLIDKYIATGMAKGVYDEKTVEKIVERGNILRPLLLGSQAPDLLMIDTTNAKITNKMGFDTAKTSKSVTQLYYDNAQKLTPLFTTLYGVKAKWTILVFWDVDCGHCQTEMPKLGETYRELVKKYDVKVFSVYTQHEYDKWRKFIIDKKMNFINVYDPVHLNNIKEKYDIFSTPVIYLLDKNKVIKAKRLSEEQLPELIKMFDSQDKDTQKK